jgi:hypothetical protein
MVYGRAGKEARAFLRTFASSRARTPKVMVGPSSPYTFVFVAVLPSRRFGRKPQNCQREQCKWKSRGHRWPPGSEPKPEASYFTAEDGKRTAFFVFDLKDPTMIPTIAEPFFMNLNASIELSPVMNLEDMKAGVEKAMKH